jgi:hypothetical protein
MLFNIVDYFLVSKLKFFIHYKKCYFHSIIPHPELAATLFPYYYRPRRLLFFLLLLLFVELSLMYNSISNWTNW